MQPQFTLESTPAPKHRTARATIERGTIAYNVRNCAYDAIEGAMSSWRKHRETLPPKAAATLGIKRTVDFVRFHRKGFHAIMRHLNVTSPKELLRRYGRTGQICWQWDHAIPIRAVNHFDPVSIAQVFSASNLRPKIASRNKRRKLEPPVIHPELFVKEVKP